MDVGRPEPQTSNYIPNNMHGNKKPTLHADLPALLIFILISKIYIYHLFVTQCIRQNTMGEILNLRTNLSCSHLKN